MLVTDNLYLIYFYIYYFSFFLSFYYIYNFFTFLKLYKYGKYFCNIKIVCVEIIMKFAVLLDTVENQSSLLN